jgi:hypothetical protein
MKYLILKRFRSNGVTYEPGTAAEFQAETAKHLLAIGRVELDSAPTKAVVEEKEEKVEAPVNRAEKPKRTRRKKA